MDKLNLTFIGQMVFFALFVWICMKTFWPFLLKMMKEREEKIAKGLEDAERASKDLQLAQNKASEQLKEAKVQAAEIVEQANKRATQMIEEAKQKALDEGNRQLAAKEAELEQMVNRAKEELRAKVSTLALAGAERILEATVDQQAHSKLVDDLAAQL